ncbi:carboxypeptidase-like regulatory domain-containing protein [Gracilibacillus kekensis]|uniref:Carboxypeptidase regulatory-like domain-containing protein n=1 Tax=Gracilibacillus kekensis TaxID=1027249 RepID=A0A1M7QU23_9BACI|nr:carboxypeptidase-like regulatory domain-containing protein [Gracilibacillus kekensis]SHN35174.1 Carboxypeptidase regulatory-like domain-containing protein [Gracilibacillus kekensis]
MNNAAIAIMEKIRKVYLEEEMKDTQFIAYNPIAIPLTEDDLSFGDRSSSLSEQERLRAAADFAVNMNLIPEVRPIWNHSGIMIWDILDHIFANVTLAKNKLSEKEKQELQSAKDFLYQPITNEENEAAMMPSAHLIAYREREEQYFDVQQELHEAIIKHKYEEDPQQQELNEVHVQQLESQVKQVVRDWEVMGYKSEIEKAFATIDELSGLGIQQLWANWKDDFNRSSRTDVLIDREFYETSFIPPAFYKDDQRAKWTIVTLNREEISELLKNGYYSKSELTTDDEIEEAQLDIDIIEVKAEVIRVEIVRNWFQPSLLMNQNWKWQNDSELLSDGEDPPVGILPAYPTAMLFVRNVSITLEKESKKNESAITDLQEGRKFAFGPIILDQVASTINKNQIHKLVATKRIEPLKVAHIAKQIPTVNIKNIEKQRVSPQIIKKATLKDFATIKQTRLDDKRLKRIRLKGKIRKINGTLIGQILDQQDKPLDGAEIAMTEPESKENTIITADEQGNYRVQLEPGNYQMTVSKSGFLEKTENVTVHPRKRSHYKMKLQKEPKKEIETEVLPSIQLIGYICTKLPKTPNPYSHLNWDYTVSHLK